MICPLLTFLACLDEAAKQRSRKSSPNHYDEFGEDAKIQLEENCRARSSRNVGQPDHILANPIISHKAERRAGRGEIWLAVTKHDGVQVDSILIDQPQGR